MSEIYEFGESRFRLLPQELVVVGEIFHQNVYQVAPEPDWQVLDIGAHKGVFSVFCARRGANVVAYEPNPDSFATLLENISINRLGDKVRAFNAAVWTDASEHVLWVSDEHPGGTSLVVNDGAARTIDVDTVPLSDILARQRWDIVKIDAEGAEFELLTETPPRLLRRIKYLTVEVHNGVGNLDQYQRMMGNLHRAFSIDGVPEVDGRFNYIYGRRQ